MVIADRFFISSLEHIFRTPDTRGNACLLKPIFQHITVLILLFWCSAGVRWCPVLQIIQLALKVFSDPFPHRCIIIPVNDFVFKATVGKTKLLNVFQFY